MLPVRTIYNIETRTDTGRKGQDSYRDNDNEIETDKHAHFRNMIAIRDNYIKATGTGIETETRQRERDRTATELWTVI